MATAGGGGSGRSSRDVLSAYVAGGNRRWQRTFQDGSASEATTLSSTAGVGLLPRWWRWPDLAAEPWTPGWGRPRAGPSGVGGAAAVWYAGSGTLGNIKAAVELETRGCRVTVGSAWDPASASASVATA
eukprot:g30147.t1